ncbi:hypothetical protein QA646_28550 (plasmid) [Rhizobium sp. CB3090]|nr:hypothetical protein [Rhizobium sp. CB3090]WFU12847.1 hypothetical protein QA646_28550 [Rhizobium sp. CB3090]
MDHTKLFPQLKETVCLKPMAGYALAHGHHPSQIQMLDPSHAFFLSLCDKGLLPSQIAFIYGQTFDLEGVDAHSQVDQLLSKYQHFL